MPVVSGVVPQRLVELDKILASAVNKDDRLPRAKVNQGRKLIDQLAEEYHRLTERTRRVPGRRVGTSCLITWRGCVLMGWHIDRCGWEFPGGGQESEETVEAACRREVREETGIVLDGKLTLLGIDETDPEWVNFVYRAELPDCDDPGHAGVCLNHGKHREWQWFPLTRIPCPLAAPAMSLLAMGLHGTLLPQPVTAEPEEPTDTGEGQPGLVLAGSLQAGQCFRLPKGRMTYLKVSLSSAQNELQVPYQSCESHTFGINCRGNLARLRNSDHVSPCRTTAWSTTPSRTRTSKAPDRPAVPPVFP